MSEEKITPKGKVSSLGLTIKYLIQAVILIPLMFSDNFSLGKKLVIVVLVVLFTNGIYYAIKRTAK